MKKSILSITILVAVSTIYSQSYLRLIKSDNSVQSFDLLTTEVRFSPNGDLFVKQGTNSDVQFSFSNVKELRFVNGTTTIASALLKENITILQTENYLYIKGFDDSELITASVFNSTGKKLISKRQLSSEPINTAALQSGIYILKLNNNQSFKFIKK